MSRGELASRALHFLGAPFRLMWAALTGVANLSAAQIRSLVTVGFLAGMISLSGENWGLTFAADHASHRFAEDAEGARAVFDLILERVRFTSALQFWLALILGAVILNADYVRLKLGQFEAGAGRGAQQEGEE